MRKLLMFGLAPLAALLLLWGCGGGGGGGGGQVDNGGPPGDAPPIPQLLELDTDGDGVPDSKDAFPTLKVASVDSDGDFRRAVWFQHEASGRTEP